MASVYEIITAQVIAQLEAGTCVWRRPWKGREPCNLISQKPYRGINQLMLGCSDFPSRFWLTFNQANKLGGRVKQGARSTMVVFWSVGNEKLNPKTGKVSTPFLLRYYRVFNLSQTENIADKLGLGEASPTPVPDIDACERIVSGMPNAPRIETDSNAWYRPSVDLVGIPAKTAFLSSEGYYATLFHELAHSTGHSSRIGREGIEESAGFGSPTYSREELIAEMGSAMLCGVTGISPVTLENSAAYLKSWIHALRGDSKLLASAASAAQKAADYVRGVKSNESEESHATNEA